MRCFSHFQGMRAAWRFMALCDELGLDAEFPKKIDNTNMLFGTYVVMWILPR